MPKKKQRKKLNRFTMLVFLIAVTLATLYAAATGARYVMKGSIDLDLSNYYCNVVNPAAASFAATPFTTSFTVTNNDGTNFMTSDLKYTIIVQDSINWNISADGSGLTRTIPKGAMSSDTPNITLTAKTPIYNNTTVTIVLNITSPYLDTKTITLTYYPLHITDGLGDSGPVPLNPLGSNIQMTGYNSWPNTSYSTLAAKFIGGVYDGKTKDIWMVPAGSNSVVKFNTVSGAMTEYNGWPTGFTKSTSTFYGGVQTDTDVWIIPGVSDAVIKIDKTTGTMTGYNSWPTGYSCPSGGIRFDGGALVGTDLYMAPWASNEIVKVDTLTGNMTGISLPAGFTPGGGAFIGAVSDGKCVWFIPTNGNMVVKLDTTT